MQFHYRISSLLCQFLLVQEHNRMIISTMFILAIFHYLLQLLSISILEGFLYFWSHESYHFFFHLAWYKMVMYNINYVLGWTENKHSDQAISEEEIKDKSVTQSMLAGGWGCCFPVWQTAERRLSLPDCLSNIVDFGAVGFFVSIWRQAMSTQTSML